MSASRYPQRSPPIPPFAPSATRQTPANETAAASQKRLCSRSIPPAAAKSAVMIGRVPKISATVVAVVSFVAYTKVTWFKKMPTTAAPTMKGMSRRRRRNECSRSQVTPTKSAAAAVKRTPLYARGLKPWLRTYFVTVKLSDQIATVTNSIRSAASGRRTRSTLPIRLRVMPEPTKEAVDALVGPATPQFAYQLRARIEELVKDLAEGDPVRRYGEEKMELLDRLGYASSKAETGGRVRRDVPGWDQPPSPATADRPLPRASAKF